MSFLPQSISKADETSLIEACRILENPSFAARLSRVVGTPIEQCVKLLPRRWVLKIQAGTEKGIGTALDMAIANATHRTGCEARARHYRMLGVVSGAVGGFFGGPALLLELPVITTLMLSAIVDIARSQGEDLGSLATRMACMEVFALGGLGHPYGTAETGYYGIRMALEIPIFNASSYLARQGSALPGSAPVLVNLIQSLAQRFGVVVSQKAAAEFVPVIGAVGGAFLNHAFMQHFQDIAYSHFTIRRLERKYAPELIQSAYERIRKSHFTRTPITVRTVPTSRRRLVKMAA